MAYHVEVVWKIWNLRVFILLSLSFQTILILVAPFRKQTGNVYVSIMIWLSYLLADYVANQAVGLIPNSNYILRFANATDPAAPMLPHPHILAFWSPFLLVHLGGPDTITALALEDNELWMRTALHLVTQVLATFRVLLQSLKSNAVLVPTILMFVVGFIKYSERALSLFRARLTKFKSSMLTDPDPGPNYAKLMESYESYKKSSIPTGFQTNLEPDQSNFAVINRNVDFDVDIENELDDASDQQQQQQQPQEHQQLSDVQLVRDAFEFFEKYKGLCVDLIFSFRDRIKSREYFHKLTVEQAFKVVEIELNLTYEVFFTKIIVIQQTVNRIVRAIAVSLEITSLVIWTLIDKRPFRQLDVRITYTLHVGAITLDIIVALRFICSNELIAVIKKDSTKTASLYNKLLSVRNRTWGKFWGGKHSPSGPWFRRIFFRRWSESISQFNLMDYCVRRWSNGAETFFDIVPLKDPLDKFVYVKKKWFADDLRNFIYNELKYKSEIADDPRDADEICDSKGDWVIRSLAGLDFDPFVFYEWTSDVEYDECLLLWHIATELLYQEEFVIDDDDLSREKEYRDYCKTLSDYMMYLLKMQPLMMFAVAGISEVRFRDTCAEAMSFIDRVLAKGKRKETEEQRHREACKRVMIVNTDTALRELKGERSKSVLFEAVRLAKELKSLREKTSMIGMWELMGKVWVELLSYSATHTRASAHAAQLKEGGELLTLVWLLMVHLGLGKQFRITKGSARSKLIISK